MTERPVQRMPRWTSDSGMIGSAAEAAGAATSIASTGTRDRRSKGIQSTRQIALDGAGDCAQSLDLGQAAGGARGAAITFTKPALDRIIDGYTREAGVRALEREIGSICRKVAREFAERSRRSKRTIRPETVEELLGKPRFQPEVKRRTSEPGVATGLAWTPVGGDVLFVEAIAYPGDGKLQVTGQLGDVMKESAAAALSYVRNLDGGLGGDVSPDWFKEHDLHLHVPAGAIPKDGPSAGITMATAIASRVTCRPVRSDTAMTGEITLTGMVLPIGGLKEKALAAQRAGIRRLIIPRRNERDIDDIPEPLRMKMTFLPVDTVDEVLDAALQKRARRSSPSQPG
jgi:ATP-dependent Lon protease